MNITVSAGVSIYPLHGEEGETLIKSADQALYEAKRAGKNDYFIAAPTGLLPGNRLTFPHSTESQ